MVSSEVVESIPQMDTQVDSGHTIVKESCPAFIDGCPYAASNNAKKLLEAKDIDNSAKCPAFNEGCPFRNAADLDALRNELQKLPPSHANDADGYGTHSHVALLETFKMVHQTSQDMKEQIGSCPVFQQECPFKNCMTSRGTPLVAELEARSWGVIVHLMETSTAEDNSNMNSTLATGPQAPDEAGLARKLKLGTQEAHTKAENTQFMREYIKGRVPRDLYAQLLVNLYHVYIALENALEKCWEHPLVEYLYFPDELCRAATLHQDLDFYCGSDWEEHMKPSQVTEEYVARLHNLAQNSPELLVAHAYTRYLGDLSGGQLLKNVAVRNYNLPPDGSGVQFYMFKRIPDFKSFKNMYRARLDSLNADHAAADAIVVEANYAFDLNTRMFQELDHLGGFENMPQTLPTKLENTHSNDINVAAKDVAAGKAAAAAGCPFATLAALGAEMPAGHGPLKAQVPIHSKPKAAAEKPLGKSRASFHYITLGALAAAIPVVAVMLLRRSLNTSPVASLARQMSLFCSRMWQEP